MPPGPAEAAEPEPGLFRRLVPAPAETGEVCLPASLPGAEQERCQSAGDGRPLLFGPRGPKLLRFAVVARKVDVARERLDRVLVERGLAESRERAQALILAGAVTVDGQIARRAAAPVGPEARVELAARLPYVSRGGLKLERALDAFDLDAQGGKQVGHWAIDCAASS